MANHPYNNHREQQVAHRRVGTILSGSPAGAEKHAKGHAFSKLTSKSAASRDDDISGRKSTQRFARGGKVKHGGGNTNIAIVLPKGGGPAPGGPAAGPLPMAGPGGPPMPPPPMGGPPPGLPPGMPMRARGGKVDGEATEGNIKKWGNRAKDNSYFTGGAISGVGRQEKAAHMKGRK
jgi:hypothetical protein